MNAYVDPKVPKRDRVTDTKWPTGAYCGQAKSKLKNPSELKLKIIEVEVTRW